MPFVISAESTSPSPNDCSLHCSSLSLLAQNTGLGHSKQACSRCWTASFKYLFPAEKLFQRFSSQNSLSLKSCSQSKHKLKHIPNSTFRPTSNEMADRIHDGSMPGYTCTVQRVKMGSDRIHDGSMPGYTCTVQRL